MNEEQKQATPEEQIKELTAKIDTMKIRIFDLSESHDEIAKEKSGVEGQLQMFVTGVLKVLDMEVGEEGIELKTITDAIEALKPNVKEAKKAD